MWAPGLILALFSAIISGGRTIFAAPGAVYIVPRYIIPWPKMDVKREYGMISLAGPLTNIALAIFFFPLTILLPIHLFWCKVLLSLGYIVNLWLAIINLLPFAPMDGYKIYRWSPLVWVSVTALACILLIYFLILFT
jgi:Zn-dependent protease